MKTNVSINETVVNLLKKETAGTITSEQRELLTALLTKITNLDAEPAPAKKTKKNPAKKTPVQKKKKPAPEPEPLEDFLTEYFKKISEPYVIKGKKVFSEFKGEKYEVKSNFKLNKTAFDKIKSWLIENPLGVVFLKNYTEKTFFVLGPVTSESNIKPTLKSWRGRYAGACVDKKRVPGWMFTAKNLGVIEDFLEDLAPSLTLDGAK